MQKIIALVALPGAGKSEVARIFKKHGFDTVRFGDITDDELKKRKLASSEANESKIRQELRDRHGEDVYAQLSIPRIEKLENVVLDGVRSWKEYTLLKNHFGKNIVLLKIDADTKTRYGRLANRKIRPLTEEECKSRDHLELYELHAKETLEKADLLLDNSGSIEELKKSIEELVMNINKLFPIG